MPWYRDINEAEVPTAAAALDFAQEAARELSIAAPRVYWFSEATKDTPGAYWRNVAMKGEARALGGIWLHVGLSGEDLLDTVAHELRHAWQFTRRALHSLAAANDNVTMACAEADARSWAAQFVARITGKPASFEALEESPARLLKDLEVARSLLSGVRNREMYTVSFT